MFWVKNSEGFKYWKKNRWANHTPPLKENKVRAAQHPICKITQMNRKQGMTANSLVHLKATDTTQTKDKDKLKNSSRQQYQQKRTIKCKKSDWSSTSDIHLAANRFIIGFHPATERYLPGCVKYKTVINWTSWTRSGSVKWTVSWPTPTCRLWQLAFHCTRLLLAFYCTRLATAHCTRLSTVLCQSEICPTLYQSTILTSHSVYQQSLSCTVV